MVSGLLSLPDEILLSIYEFVDEEHHLFGGLSLTCWRFRQLSMLNSIWAIKCQSTCEAMGMNPEFYKYIGDPRAFHYDQMKARKTIYALLDEIVLGGSGSPTPADCAYTAYEYSLIRKICEYKEKALPSLQLVSATQVEGSRFNLCHQFYAKSIIAVIVKQRALEVVKSHSRFSGYCLLDFVMAVRDMCSDSLNYELLLFRNYTTLNTILVKVCDYLDVPTSRISKISPLMVVEALNSFMRSDRYVKLIKDDFRRRLGRMFAVTGISAFYTHIAQHLGLNACMLVFESWTCVLITEESGAAFFVDVALDYRARPTTHTPFFRTLDKAILDSAIATGAKTIVKNLDLERRTGISGRTVLELNVLRDLFGEASMSYAVRMLIGIPLYVLVLEKVYENLPASIKRFLDQTLNARGKRPKPRRNLPAQVEFKIGQLCKLKLTGALGVIVGWDLEILVSRGKPKLQEVRYQWLSRNKEFYVFQSGLAASPERITKLLQTAKQVADYAKLGEYFMRFDEWGVEPNRRLRCLYPDD